MVAAYQYHELGNRCC